MVGRWRDVLWAEASPAYRAILAHPFLAGLRDGTLPDAVFAEYLTQDAHYLREYARALTLVATKADTAEWTELFAAHAARAIEVEPALHASLLLELGVSTDGVSPSPTCVAYTSYLVAVTATGSFAEAVAAVLPCYWIYARVGAALIEAGSPDRRYQRWIDTYAGPEFAATVSEVLDVVDAVGAGLGAAAESQARRHVALASRYEWMFWDAAYRLERWPL